MLKEFEINGTHVKRGERKKVEIPISRLFDFTEMNIPVEVIRGNEDGAILFISAALHGDEINGVEIIKRLLAKKKILSKIKGTLIAVPIVNVFGFNRNIRYLPDRRDLNRCFPGSENGSLGGQIANIFMKEIVSKCTHGIDLHTGAIHRTNLPQIRACLDKKDNKNLAYAFGVPVVLDSNIRDGSLRQAANEIDISMLLYEGGEALRYDEKVIKQGLNGILSVMQEIGMIDVELPIPTKKEDVYIAKSSYWVRAPHSGSLRAKKKIGTKVEEGSLLGVISNPYGENKIQVRAREKGIIIGMTMLPLVNNGDALFHIATFKDSQAVENRVEEFDEITA